MAATTVEGIDGMRSLVGERIGPTDWRTVSQTLIDNFAALSGDFQWIHVNAERAKAESPYGATIAHGNLTLSLVDGFRKDLIEASGFALGINYGWNRVRFPAPVVVGSRVRGWAEGTDVEPVGDDGWFQVVTTFEVEVEGGEKPCFVGESVTRLLVA